MVYGHANGKDIAETLDEVARYIDLGYKAIRAQSGVPGLASTYGVSKDRMYYEPADAALPTENIWSTAKYLDHAPKLFEAIRARFGFDHHILHDVHHRLTPIEAARLGKSLEPYRHVLDGGSDAGREPGRLPHHPPAHGDADRGRRGVQHDLRLPDADHRAADRLHPHDGRSRRRHHAPAAHRASCRALSRAHGLARRDRPVAGVHGRGAQFRHVGTQLRRAGIHAAHAGDRRGLSARLPLRERLPAPGGRAGSRRRHRREARREVSVQGQLRCRSIVWRTARCGTGELHRRRWAAVGAGRIGGLTSATKSPDLPPDFSSSRTPSMRMPAIDAPCTCRRW